MESHARILVVEDDGSARAALAALLELEGYVILTAADGKEALERLGDATVDLVVSDVLMPAMDGFELVEKIRAEPFGRDTPVILLSALDAPERRVRGLDLGADDYVAKPINADELLARIRVQLRRASRSQQLQQFAVVDELTNSLNRRGLSEVLGLEWKRTERSGAPLSVLVIDLNEFKAVNDRHGHHAGDAVLAHVAKTLAGGVRAHDRVARLGGDEFAIVLPETGREEAEALAGRLRQAVDGRFWLPDGQDIALRISVGAATAEEGDCPETLLSRADAAMYQDKERIGAALEITGADRRSGGRSRKSSIRLDGPPSRRRRAP